MRDFDISPLKENDIRYGKLVEDTASCFNCDWDDAVHDSYLTFVKQLKELSDEARRIRCRTESLEKEAESLNMDKILSEAESLCREAETV